jgi:hypothetical protein
MSANGVINGPDCPEIRLHISMTILGRFCCCAAAGTVVTVTAATPASRPRHSARSIFIGFPPVGLANRQESNAKERLALCIFGRRLDQRAPGGGDPDDRFGSDSEVSTLLDHFRFAPLSGHRQAGTPSPKSARSGRTVDHKRAARVDAGQQAHSRTEAWAARCRRSRMPRHSSHLFAAIHQSRAQRHIALLVDGDLSVNPATRY